MKKLLALLNRDESRIDIPDELRLFLNRQGIDWFTVHLLPNDHRDESSVVIKSSLTAKQLKELKSILYKCKGYTRKSKNWVIHRNNRLGTYHLEV